MAHFHHGHAATTPIEHLLARLLQYFDRQHRRTGAEIKSTFHCFDSGKQNSLYKIRIAMQRL
jgi:hypothetical protein